MATKAKYKIVPSDVTQGNWHIYVKNYWGWNRIPDHWGSIEKAEQYLREITGQGRLYDAEAKLITEAENK